ncbi:MAG: kinase/pyrophosphorylase [Nitrospirae bacterium]|nr:kinase/pyrophosphorylase [Nitrospirota bacterium]MBI3595116.1 kinase/pyrophosphorylase [Nitrospirota bacterium]
MNDGRRNHQLFIVSDSTGDTAERAALAVLSQFKNRHQIGITRFRNIKSEIQVKEVIQRATSERAFIVYTFVSESLRKLMDQAAVEADLPAVDLIGPLLGRLETYLHKLPSAEPGLIHRVDQQYLTRMDAVQFAVKHDDGQSLHTLIEADMILVGPSRSGKTPLSMYLAQFGWKVANIPLILNITPPHQLFQAPQNKIIALLTDFELLTKVRKARIRNLKQAPSINYADPSYIDKELNYCSEIYRYHPDWKKVSVSGRAVEEVAADILTLLGLQK